MSSTIRAVAFDLFGTSIEFVDKRNPYGQSSGNGRGKDTRGNIVQIKGSDELPVWR